MRHCEFQLLFIPWDWKNDGILQSSEFLWKLHYRISLAIITWLSKFLLYLQSCSHDTCHTTFKLPIRRRVYPQVIYFHLKNHVIIYPISNFKPNIKNLEIKFIQPVMFKIINKKDADFLSMLIFLTESFNQNVKDRNLGSEFFTKESTFYIMERHTSEADAGGPYWHHLWWGWRNLSWAHAVISRSLNQERTN